MSSFADLEAYLSTHVIAGKVIFKPPTRTTADACSAMKLLGYRCALSDFIKALVMQVEFGGDASRTILVLVAGTDSVDVPGLERQFAARITIPNAETARLICGYERGGTPPIGCHGVMCSVVDHALIEPPRLLFGGGGDAEHVLQIHSAELMRGLRLSGQCVVVTSAAPPGRGPR